MFSVLKNLAKKFLERESFSVNKCNNINLSLCLCKRNIQETAGNIFLLPFAKQYVSSVNNCSRHHLNSERHELPPSFSSVSLFKDPVGLLSANL